MQKQEIVKPLISIAIITFNEERIIEHTLNAVCNWADEIVIVDSFSTDNTISILNMYQVNLYQKEWQGYSKQKNFALSKCTGRWILALDADEIVGDTLRDEILAVANKDTALDGFKIRRKFYIGKKWIKYGGYYPDYQLRLFKNGKNAYFSQREVHESIVINGNIGYLNNALDHYAYSNLNQYRKSLKKYSELASKEIKSKLFYVPLLRAIWAFIFRYLFRLGFVEGKLGFRLCLAYSNYVYEKYKLAEKNSKGSNHMSMTCGL